MKRFFATFLLLVSGSAFAGEIHSNCQLNQEMRNAAASRINQVGFQDVYSEAELRIKAGAIAVCVKEEGGIQYLVTTWEVFSSSSQETMSTTEVFVQK